MGRFSSSPGDTWPPFLSPGPRSAGHTHAWAPDTHPATPGLEGRPAGGAKRRKAGQRLCPPIPPAPSWPFRRERGAGPAPHTQLPPDRGDTCHWGRGVLHAPVATDGNSKNSIWGPHPEGQRHPGPARGEFLSRGPRARPGSRTSPPSPSRGPGHGAGRAAFRPGRGDTHRSARPPLGPLRPRWAASRRRGGSGPADPARPAAPRGSTRRRRRQLAPRERPGPRGHAPRPSAGATGVGAGAGGRRGRTRWTALRRGPAAPRAPQRPLLPERAEPAAHSLTRRRGCASVRPCGERRRGRARAASAGRTWPVGAPALAEPGAARSPHARARARCHAGTPPGRAPGRGPPGSCHSLSRTCPATR